MPETLLDAHAALDKAMDAVFGFRKVPTEYERQRRLFERFAEAGASDQLAIEVEAAPKRRRTKK